MTVLLSYDSGYEGTKNSITELKPRSQLAYISSRGSDHCSDHCQILETVYILFLKVSIFL